MKEIKKLRRILSEREYEKKQHIHSVESPIYTLNRDDLLHLKWKMLIS